jgi:hypothetical protein
MTPFGGAGLARPTPSALAARAFILLLTSLGLAGGDLVVIRDIPPYAYTDAMFEAYRLALAARGEPYSAAYIQGLSGMAFRIAGPCPCAPTCSSGVSPEELLTVLGYEYELLYLGSEAEALVRPVEEVVERVKAEVRAGRPVPVWHAFTTAEWDIVCGYDDTRGVFLGRGSYAGTPKAYAEAPQARMAEAVSVCPAFGAMIIGSKTGNFDARAAELAALEEAVRHAHGQRDPFLDDPAARPVPWRMRQGEACYDAWIRRYADDPNTVPTTQEDRYPLGVHASTRQAAPAFLREIAPHFPEAKLSLDRAGEHLATEAETLSELMRDLLGWEANWNEPDAAKAARTVELLTRARDDYTRGIRDLERALAAIGLDAALRATQRAVIQRGPDAVILRGVGSLLWGRGQDCTFIGTLNEALKFSPDLYTYPDLMGLSGLAFRTRWSNGETATKWCGSCAVGEMPDEYELLQALTGYSLDTVWEEREGRDNEALAKLIMAEVDAGRPLIGYPDSYDMAVIHGYAGQGRTVLVTPYRDPQPEGTPPPQPVRLPVDRLEPLRTVLGTRTTPPAPREALRTALQAAVTNWRRTKHDGGLPGREYWYGEAALEAWERDLRAADAYPVEARQKLLGLDGWVRAQLVGARTAAAQFLKAWSCVTQGDARAALLRAADLYEQEGAAIAEYSPQGRPAAAAEWTAEDRHREADALAEARRLGAQATAEIEQALAAL